MPDNKIIPKKTQALLDKLKGSDQKTQLNTIRLLEAEGNVHVLEPLYDVYKLNSDNPVGAAIADFFDKLIDSSCIEKVVDLMRKEENFEFRKMLIISCWQNKLDFSPYLADFVAMAVEGDFFEAFECLTVIENFEETIQETQILESQLYLKEFLENEKGQNEQKDKIISEIALLLKDFDQNLEG